MARQEPGTGRYSRWSAGNQGFEDDTIGPVEGGLGWYLAGQPVAQCVSMIFCASSDHFGLGHTQPR